MPQLNARRLVLKVLGIPKPKQSFKFTRTGHRYTDAKVLALEANFRSQVVTQLPKNFQLFDGPLKLTYTFVFPAPKGMPKSDVKKMEEGGKVWKISRPDMPDNLKKGCNDAMNGVVFTDDARIVKDAGEKYYGKVPYTEIIIEELK